MPRNPSWNRSSNAPVSFTAFAKFLSAVRYSSRACLGKSSSFSTFKHEKLSTLKAQPLLVSQNESIQIDRTWITRLQALMSVDEMVGKILAKVRTRHCCAI